MNKKNINGLALGELEDFALSIGEKRFRGKQLFEWLYMKEVQSFAGMTSLSKATRERLHSMAEIRSIAFIEALHSSNDDTIKYLFELPDGKRVESVLIPPNKAFQNNEAGNEDEQKRQTLCISTQVGCPLDCVFCATASMGFLRNLTTGEILDQVVLVKKHSGKRITNVVYMGMGEPLMNYDNVMRSAEIITTAMGIAARRVTVSTAGWVPGIRQMADESRKIKLAFSLHSLDNALRTSLMPVNKKYPLAESIEALEYYYRKTKQRITFEYILFDGVNDKDDDVRKIVKLSKRIPCKINVIPFHHISTITQGTFAAGLKPTPVVRMNEFVEKLRNNFVTVFVRSSAGEDITAACGQLAVAHQKRKMPGRKERHIHPSGAVSII